MQATADGEFYPEKDLDKNYRIPKRSIDQVNNASSSTKNDQYNAAQTPLANSYYNYPYDPSVASAYYQNYSHYYQQYGQAGAGPVGNLNILPPPPPATGVEPIKQNIYKTLKDIKEKPKNYTKNVFESTVPDLMDESLPKELKALFQPLYCKLCSAQHSSNHMARMHYKSKNHEKQIRKWLIEYCEKTGEPLPKRAKISNDKKEAEKNPTWFHCDVCDLDLTGKLHAESHYMGKNHQRAIMGYKAPAGQGYFDDNGKWVRTKGQKSKSFNFNNGEDNFGLAFKKQEAQKIEEPTPTPPAQKKKKDAQPGTNYHCDVCDINTTCQDQLDSHFRGQKHMKKLRQLGLGMSADDQPAPLTPNISESSVSLVGTEIDLSVYRTPSGDYYCPTCNIASSKCEISFVQHIKSKHHAKRMARKNKPVSSSN